MKRLAWTLALLAAVGCGGGGKGKDARPVKAMTGHFKLTVQATGNVQPLNKVEIIPPVAGRIDKIIALEGADVKKGQVLAWMSSAERAVLLDNARAKGDTEIKYWEEAYAPTPVVAPVDGTVIARDVVAGQTVGLQTVVYELSDRLIVQAAVDETDLGKIHGDQKADVTVDAYPDRPFTARVRLIGHQAVKVNNVVAYYVQLEPERTPGSLRAGMTANVDFILEERDKVLLLPAWAVRGAERTTLPLKVAAEKGGKPESRDVLLGASDGSQVEVLRGLKEGDRVLVDGFKLPEAASTGIFNFGPRSGQAGTKGAGGQAGGQQGGAGRRSSGGGAAAPRP